MLWDEAEQKADWVIRKTGSSTVKTVVYFEDDQLLFVEFLKGGRYIYYAVPRDIFVLVAGKIATGQSFLNFIKGQYEYKRIAK